MPDDHAVWLCSRCKSSFGAISSPSKLRSIHILRSYLAPFPEGATLTEVFGWMCLVPQDELGRVPKEKEIEQVYTLCRVMWKAVLGLHYKRQEQKRSGQLAIF